MSVVEDFFERFEKGEIRTVEAEYVGTDDDNTHTTDANGQLAVTVSDLVSVEDAVSVLVADPDNDGENIDVDVAATDGVSVCKGTADIDEFDADAGGDRFREGASEDSSACGR